MRFIQEFFLSAYPYPKLPLCDDRFIEQYGILAVIGNNVYRRGCAFSANHQLPYDVEQEIQVD